MSVNKAILVGNVGANPEVRHLESGIAVANFTLATSETYTPKGKTEKVTNTEWHRIVVWDKLAEVIEKYVKKGQQLYVEGSIRTRSWEDKEGVKKYTTEIVVRGFGDKIEMLGRKGEVSDNVPSSSEADSAPEVGEGEDLPF